MKSEKQMEADREVTRQTLQPYVDEIAQDVVSQINTKVPASIPTMPYTRQWVLEEVAKKLQSLV
jgi:hypothetical protein